jgi:hypothetical protein
MKKLNLLFTLMVVALLGVMTSCEEESTDPQPPTLDFKGGANYIAQDATVDIGSDFVIGINVASNAETEAELTNVTVERIFDNVPQTVIDTTFDKNVTSFSADVTFETQSSEGEERIVFTAEDEDGESVTKEIKITYESSPEPINTYSAVLMGAQSNLTTGSFLNSHTGDVSLQDAAEANSGDIDVIYYFGSTNNATLTAPDDATVNGGSGNLSLAESFTTKNATRFNTNPGVSESEFDAMTDDETIITLSDFSASKVTQLGVGEVIAFETADGKKGLIKVSDLEDGASGSIEIHVKVQQ